MKRISMFEAVCVAVILTVSGLTLGAILRDCPKRDIAEKTAVVTAVFIEPREAVDEGNNQLGKEGISEKKAVVMVTVASKKQREKQLRAEINKSR